MVKLPSHVLTVSRAKNVAAGKMPYLSSYLASIPTTYTDKVPTMAVDDCGRLYINPSWIADKKDEQVAYVLLHEVCHNLLSHAVRRAQAIPQPTPDQCEVWNYAADLCVQQLLRDIDNFRPKPSVSLADYTDIPAIQAGMSTEAYYAILWGNRKPKQPDPNGGQAGQGQGPGQQPQGGDGNPMPSGSSSDGVPRDYELDREIHSQIGNVGKLEEVRQKIAEGGGRGMGAGELASALAVRLVPQPDPFQKLKSIIAREIKETGDQTEYSYRRRSKMQQCDDILFKGELKAGCECVIVVDTSGSMGHPSRSKRVQRACSVIAAGVKRLGRPVVICWDGAMQTNERMSSLKGFQWKGGGGTSMDEALVYADTTYKPDAIVLVTDGETGWPDKPTSAKLIVASVTGTMGPAWAINVDLTKEPASYAR